MTRVSAVAAVGMVGAAALLLRPAGAGPEAAPPPPAPPEIAVAWSPEAPVQGTLMKVSVQPVEPVAVAAVDGQGEVPLEFAGEAAGQPLHFHPDGAGGYRALAAVPIDTEGVFEVALSARRGDGPAARKLAQVPVTPGDFRLERLRVAPEFGEEPDSALAARIAADRVRVREVGVAAHRTPRQWEAPFLRPRQSRITSGFGHGREFNGVVQSRHMGVDFAGAVGTPVLASNRGIVALIGDFFAAGTAVYLDHGAGLVTAYFHLSAVDVQEGQVVERGERIGSVGATGRVTGPHLHWVGRYGTVTFDPLTLLELEVAAER
jgi:murein DD-endopeptidase MepM/ murein hydrolase activator NlpD